MFVVAKGLTHFHRLSHELINWKNCIKSKEVVPVFVFLMVKWATVLGLCSSPHTT